MSADPAPGTFEATVASLAPIRRLITQATVDLGRPELGEDAVLCGSELASNAILHTRLPFDVDVEGIDGGLRVVVVDRRPQDLPAVVPATGLATDITSQGTTGRGLQIVASIADRWGVTTDVHTKAVWVELRPGSSGARSSPVVVEAHPRPVEGDEVVLELRSLPVRAAVASGMHLDGLVRELQLDADRINQVDMDRLYRLLDQSAPIRLEGRRLALQAAARDEERYDLNVRTSLDALVAVAKVDQMMAELLRDRRRSPLPPDVAALRAWLREEAERQLSGLEPTTCTLP